ncbi:hypothetical protein PZ895_07575, partial [Mesorhizobium sp. YIM 152430]|uniref:hypothetical protein n=1 Tax=Mesorhizobium sp. YIM 152430 TaxID=3031761 RepID=UPI0023D9EAA4
NAMIDTAPQPSRPFICRGVYLSEKNGVSREVVLEELEPRGEARPEFLVLMLSEPRLQFEEWGVYDLALTGSPRLHDYDLLDARFKGRWDRPRHNDSGQA